MQRALCPHASNTIIHMRHSLYILSLIATLLLAIAPASAQMELDMDMAQLAQMMPQLKVDPAVRTGQLPNGLTYYIRHNAWPEGRAYFYIAQNVGSMQEDDHQRGLAHFLEHICFNGTTHFPGNSLKLYLESIGVKFGADLNAYTSFDQTVYLINNVRTDSEARLDSCLLILHDWSCDLLLLDEEIDKERGVINEEWRMRRSAVQRLYEAALPEVYPDCKYGQRMPIGTMDIVMNFPYQDLRDYYHKWYRPDLQAVIVVGDIDVDQMEQKIQALFGPIPAPGADAAERVECPVPDNNEPLVSIHADKEMPVSQLMLMLKHDIMPKELKSTPLFYLQEYVNNAIGSMFSNRIDELLQQAEPPFLSAGMSDESFFVSRSKDALTGFVSFKDNGQTEALAALYREMLRAARHGFTAAEYERFRQEYLSQLEKVYSRRDKVETRQYVQECVTHFTDGEPMPGIEKEYALMQALVPMLPLEAINTQARELITETDTNLVLILFAPEKEGIVLPSADELLSVLHSVRAEDIEPYTEEVSDEPLVSDELPGAAAASIDDAPYDTKLITLANGVRIHVKTTDFTPNSISMQAISDGGQSLYGNDDYLDAAFSDAIDLGGWGTFSAIDLGKRLAGIQASVSPYVSSHTEGLRGNCVTKDLETLLQLTYLCFTAPRRDDEAYASYINRQREALRNADLRPTTALQDTMAVALYGPNNPRHVRTKADDLDRLSYARMLDIYSERFADGDDFEFFFVGDIDLDAALPLFEKYLGSLPTLPSSESKQDDGSRITDGILVNIFEKQQETPNAIIFQLFHAHMEDNLRNSLMASILGQLLQRVYTESVREDEGGAYGVPVYGGLVEEYPETYAQLLIQLPTAPEKRERMMQIISQGIDQICDNGPRQEDLDIVVEYLHRSHEENLKKNNYWMSSMQRLARYGLDYVTDYDSAVDSISTADIQAFANTVLRSGNHLTVGMTSPQP